MDEIKKKVNRYCEEGRNMERETRGRNQEELRSEEGRGKEERRSNEKEKHSNK